MDTAEVNYENEWTPEIELFASRVANRNGAMQWLHNRTYESYMYANKVWTILMGILIFICGGSGIPTVIVDVPAATYVFQGVTMATGAVIVIQGFVALGELAAAHQDAGTRNSEQFLFIAKELKEPNFWLRVRGTRFLHMILEREVAIKNKEVHIPARQVRKYYRQFGSKAVPYSELFGEGDVMHIDDDLIKLRAREASVVNKVMAQSTELRRSQQMQAVPVEPLLDDELEEQLRLHDNQKLRYKRNVPPPDSDQLRIIGNYMSAVNE